MWEYTMVNKQKTSKDFQELHHQGKNGHFLAFVRRRMCKFYPKQYKRKQWNVQSSSVDRLALVQPQQATKCSHSHAGFDDQDSGMQDLLDPCLEPKHKIFLSHSGAQKNFTEQLCKDLERIHHFPFFDKRPDSLPKGENFPPLILKAAKQCHVAVLVLSEEFFTRSKWPMIELNAFVQAQASTNTCLKILPLFLGLSFEQFKDAGRHAEWLKRWQVWASEDERIDVKKWMHALLKVPGQNGMEYDATLGEVTYREKVLAAICKLVPPDIKWDVSHVQALPQLCEPILHQMNITTCHRKYHVKVVGLFGMGGAGKTTISKVLCNQLFGNFSGKVCHVELGGKNLVELQKKVLKELTGASVEILTDDDKLASLLKSRMQRQKVFLSLDNVSDDQIDEARMYLEVGYHQESIVLVTARSIDILKSLRISKRDCMEMPELKKEDATNLFLYHAAPHENLNVSDWKIIDQCVEKCLFVKRDAYHYLPLALKVWGSQLGSISPEPLKWVKSLNILNSHKFNPLRVLNHPVFSLLRQGYDMLRPEERHIFLDLALFVSPLGSHYMFSVWDWLSIIHKKSRDIIENSLDVLRRRALLDEINEDSMEFKIHDMYLDFAREEIREGPFDTRRILYSLKESGVPPELLKYPSGSCWPRLERLAIHETEAQSLERAKLNLCSNVDVLQLFDCEQLAEVNVQGMHCLISLDIIGCYELGEKFEGVEKLQNLVWFRWMNIWQPAPFLQDMSLLKTLEVLDLKGEDSRSLLKLPPDLSGCINLREITLSRHENLASFPDLKNLSKLETIDFSLCSKALGFPDLSNLSMLWNLNFSSCESATSITGLSSLTNLKYLNLANCPLVKNFQGLGDLIALQKLNIELTGISELPDLRKLKHVQDVSVFECENLTSLVGLEHVTSLQNLYAHDCGILIELPNFSHWKGLKIVDLSCTGISKLPIDFEKFARHRILKVQGCYNLFEPLVNLLKVQQQQQQGSFSNAQTVDQLEDSMREDIVYYLYKCFERSTWLIDVETILKSSVHIVNELEAGIEFVIKEICEHEDMGILSFIIGKYAATGRCWRKLTAKPTLQPLVQRIVQFLDKQLHSTIRDEAISKNDIGYTFMNYSTYYEVRCIHLVLGILISKNEVMAQALVGDGVCTLINHCLEALESDKYIIDTIGREDYDDFINTFESWLKRLK